MSDAPDGFALLEAITATLKAYRERYREAVQLSPLLVPDWYVATCEAEGFDLDARARLLGFDGYETYDY